MNKNKFTQLWLILSAFGIMFAVLSWAQESGILPPTEILGVYKGVIAFLTGLGLYEYVAKKMN